MVQVVQSTQNCIVFGDFNTQLLIKSYVSGTRFYFIDKNTSIPELSGDDVKRLEYVYLKGYTCESQAPSQATSQKMRGIHTAQVSKTFVNVKATIDYILSLNKIKTAETVKSGIIVNLRNDAIVYIQKRITKDGTTRLIKSDELSDKPDELSAECYRRFC